MNQPQKNLPANAASEAEQVAEYEPDEWTPTSAAASKNLDQIVTVGDKSTQSRSSSRSRRRLFCFQCNRPEGHFLASERRWFYSFLLGLTFGIINLFGPYRCQCCGAVRMMAFNAINPRYWFRTSRHHSLAKQKKRR